MSTEKTPLASANPNFGSAQPIPFYVQDARRFYSRRRRERQLQCIMFVSIVAAFIMALIITISYSVNHPDVEPPEMSPSTIPPFHFLQSTGGLSAEPGFAALQLGKEAGGPMGGLSVKEVKLAVAAGDAAIAARRLADQSSQPLPRPSPSLRHQYAVSTNARADQLALRGVAEIAATRNVEKARSFMGLPSSVGSFLDGGWAPEDVCLRPVDLLCPVHAQRYRSFDGSCNHPRQLGRAFAPYKRVLPPDYADGIDAPRTGKFGNPLPSARQVSLKVHAPSPSSDPSFTVMLAVFGQFLDHDITATAISQGANGSSITCCPPLGGSHPECFPVQIGPGDPVYDLTDTTCMEFVRSAPAAQCQIGPRQQLSQVTAFIDGSTIYGSDVDTARELREFAGGRLRMQLTPDGRSLLPPSTNPDDGCNRELELARGRYCFASGDARANENLHLTTMHLLWARQHNRLAGQLAAVNPHWDDERLYHESRRIVGAQMQHITYNEFVPIVLGESEVAKRNLKPLPAGFRTKDDVDVDPSIANHFAAAAFRFAHTLLPGLMKVTDDEKGTSSYMQLHKMLFNPYSLYSNGGVESSITSATSNTIQKTSTHVTSQLTAHLFEDPLSNKTIPCGLDLVSLNIQRGRDHGIPGYTKWREYCGLPKPLKFTDLTSVMDPEALDGISKLYDNVDDVDLYTGALAELPKGDGLIGPTFTCLIARQFERIQLGDKYWYELADQPGSFSAGQLAEIRKTSLARVICDTSDSIAQVQAKVMRSTGPNNPIISCEDIPDISLTAWKSELPLLSLTETEISAEDWLNFKSEVNQTILDIVSNIMARKPPPGSLPADWLAFQHDLNNTFIDLGNKFAALHPKVITNSAVPPRLLATPDNFDWFSIKNGVDRTVAEIMDTVSANKPGPDSLPSDWLAYRTNINNTIMNIRRKFNIIHPNVLQKPVSEKLGDFPIVDWVAIKNEINATITDVVSSINATKPAPGTVPVDWIAFKQKINDTFLDIKNQFGKLHPKPVLKLGDAAGDSLGPIDWKVKYMKPKSKPANVTGNDNEDNATDTAEAVTVFDWTIFVKPKPKPQPQPQQPQGPTEWAGEPLPFDWIQFKDQLNGTLSPIISSIIARRPSPGSSEADWLTFQNNVNNTFNKFMDSFAGLRPKLTLQLDQPPNLLAKDVAKKNVNKTVEDIAAQIKAVAPLSGSPQEDWLEFGQKINTTFASMRKKYAFLYASDPSVIVNKAPPGPGALIDIVRFREDLNKSLTDLGSAIKTKKPGINSPITDWLAFKQGIKASVNQLKNKVIGFKTKELVDTDAVEYAVASDPAFDWIGWKNQINKTIDGLLIDVTTIPPDDVEQWASFHYYLNKTFSDLKDNIATIRVKPPQTKLMSMMNQDWLSFKDGINSTIEDALDDIYSSKPAPGDPAWLNYNVYIKKRIAQMKQDLIAMKEDWLEKISVATEMMNLTNANTSAISSASSWKIILHGINKSLISAMILSIAFFTS